MPPHLFSFVRTICADKIEMLALILSVITMDFGVWMSYRPRTPPIAKMIGVTMFGAGGVMLKRSRRFPPTGSVPSR